MNAIINSPVITQFAYPWLFTLAKFISDGVEKDSGASSGVRVGGKLIGAPGRRGTGAGLNRSP